ncbi:MAG TPA: primosomal protein N', partial [Chromatiales bacterium]|nr:primosomal protein N' [Chromatiales bacterium]
MSQRLILHVAVPAPLFGKFDYLPPKGADAELLQPGVRLLVPFGRGRRCGVLLKADSRTSVPTARLKHASVLLDDTPLLRGEDLDLLQWAARYYQHPLGEVATAALPVRLRKGKPSLQQRPDGFCLTNAGRAALESGLRRAPRQQAVLEALTPYPEGMDRAGLYTLTGECAAVLRTLVEKGWIAPCRPPPKASAASSEPPPPPDLYPAQQKAVDRVLAQDEGYKAFLLDGVTGSGKTEVYLTLTRSMLEQGRQALILVPEIALTPQLMRRFHERLGQQVVLLHSGLNEGEREQAWTAARKGEARVVVGTRSAVFTPLPDLGLIVVDEEHDLSFKQQEGFRYSARDVAVMRARSKGCPVVLGSATPSLESLHNVATGRYERLHLPHRAGAAEMPRMQLVDIRSAPLKAGLAPRLLEEVASTLAAGDQVMLFLNRRGYAPVIICHDCGWTSRCPRCDANMTLHLGSQLLWCHHCGHQRRLPPACPDCGSTELRPLGQGTERLEGLLTELFPDHPIARIERDNTRRKGTLER